MKWVWASARYLAFGRSRDRRQPNAMLAPPEREDFSAAAGLCVGLAFAPAFFGVARTSAQRGLFPVAPHTLAVGAESRTQRRHAAHGAVQALGTPAGSIVPIVFTGRKSALSARLRKSTVCRCCGRYPPEFRFLLEPQRFPVPAG